MSRIRAKDTKPEILLRKFLHSNGFRYRLHSKKLPGKPDIVLAKYKTVIFVHGCFWHGHKNCKYFAIPKTRSEWWINKITRNAQNDQVKGEILKKLSWRIILIWECELKADKRQTTLQNLKTRLLTQISNS